MRRRLPWAIAAAGAVLVGLGVVKFSPLGPVSLTVGFLMLTVTLLASRDLSGESVWLRALLVAWVAYFVSGLPLRVRGAAEIEASVLDSAAALRVVLVAGVGLVVLALLFRRSEKSSALAGGRLFSGAAILLCYGGFALLSSLWSISPMWTAYKSVEYLVGLALAMGIAFSIRSLDDLKSVVNVTWSLYVVLLGLVWAGFLLAPSRAMIATRGLFGWRLGGVFPVASTNTVGDLAATVLLIALVRLAYSEGSRRWWIALLAAASGALFLSQARSALLGVVAAVVVLSILLPRIRRQGVLLGVGLGTLGYVFVDLLYSYLARGQSQGNLESLSGRTLYWGAAIELWSQHPIVGAGAYAAGRFGVLQELGEQFTSSLHNTWIEVLVGTGVVGVAIVAAAVLAVVVAVFRMARAESNSQLGHITAELCAILVLELVRSVFTSGAFIWHPATRFLLAVTVCMAYATVAQSMRSSQIAAGDAEPLTEANHDTAIGSIAAEVGDG